MQLGLRDAALRRYVREWTLGIEDITDFVRAQHRHALTGDLDALETPREEVYAVTDPVVAARLGVDPLAVGALTPRRVYRVPGTCTRCASRRS